MIAAITLNVSVDRKYIVENARTGAVNRVKECVATAGGKGLNVTRVISALGEEVVAGGIVGGNLGRFVCEQLDTRKICHHFTRVSGETRCCINICDSVTGVQTEYLEPGLLVSAAETEAFLQDYRELCAQCSVITLSGSLPRGMEKDTYAKLIRIAAEAGRPVLLDASGDALLRGIEADPYYIKPNEDEIGTLYPCDTGKIEEVAAGALKLARNGIEHVVVSMGKEGALLACSEGVFLGKPPVIRAVNTVGCGDSMTAAFAIAAEKKMPPADAMKYAVAVSAASALHPDTGGVDPKTVHELWPQVTVRRM